MCPSANSPPNSPSSRVSTKAFLSEEKWRTEKDSTANSDWSLHLTSFRNPQKDDFIPVDVRRRNSAARQILQNPSNNPDKSTIIHSQAPENPHDPLKST